VFPTQLARAGIDPALRSFLARGGLADVYHADNLVAGRRFATPVEAAVYSCSAAAVREFAEVLAIDLSLEENDVVVHLHGNRRADEDMEAILDRAEALGGSVSATSDAMVVRIPVGVEQPAPALADGRGPHLG
jgi:hypothetical protein